MKGEKQKHNVRTLKKMAEMMVSDILMMTFTYVIRSIYIYISLTCTYGYFLICGIMSIMFIYKNICLKYIYIYGARAHTVTLDL